MHVFVQYNNKPLLWQGMILGDKDSNEAGPHHYRLYRSPTRVVGNVPNFYVWNVKNVAIMEEHCIKDSTSHSKLKNLNEKVLVNNSPEIVKLKPRIRGCQIG